MAAKNVKGNVIQRNGWFHVVINYYDETGKRKQKAIATGLPVKNNKRKAEARCKELVNEWEKKLSLTNSEVLFSDFLKEWLEHHRSRIADSTYVEYAKNIHRIICPYFAEKKGSIINVGVRR